MHGFLVELFFKNQQPISVGVGGRCLPMFWPERVGVLGKEIP